jgi:hypothetical protein
MLQVAQSANVTFDKLTWSCALSVTRRIELTGHHVAFAV